MNRTGYVSRRTAGGEEGDPEDGNSTSRVIFQLPAKDFGKNTSLDPYPGRLAAPRRMASPASRGAAAYAGNTEAATEKAVAATRVCRRVAEKLVGLQYSSGRIFDVDC